jgi:hypothetical protein
MPRPLVFLTYAACLACGPGPKDPEPTSTGGGDATTSALTGDPPGGTAELSGANTGLILTGSDTTSTSEDNNISDTTAAVTSDVTATILTTGASMHGQCGWDTLVGKYGCAPDATPDAQDPSGTYLIDCPQSIPVGTSCDDIDGPITSFGCCRADGSLYYCDVEDEEVVVAKACGE